MAESLFGKISSNSPFSPNLPDSSKSPLRRYPYLELNRSLAKFCQNRHSRRIRRIRQNCRFVGTPILSSIDLRAQSLFGEIPQNSHSHQIRWIRQNRCFVGTPISSSIAFWRNSSKSPFSPNLSKSPLRRYPYLELNRSSPKFVKIAILAEFVKIAASSVPLSRAQLLFGEIRQNRDSRRIRQNHRFVGTPISNSIAFWRNSSKSPFSPNSSKSALRRYPYLELKRSSAKFVKITIFIEFAGFVKIAASSVPLFRAESLFAEIRQNRHSRRIRRICQNRRFVCTPILS